MIFNYPNLSPFLDRHVSEMSGRLVDLEHDYVYELWY